MASNQYTTVAELFAACPFSSSREHTLEPMAISSKLSWLESNCNYNSTYDAFTKLMYIKVDTATSRGSFRLESYEDRSYYYNYCYVNNKGNKFFAYITGCRYINDGATSGKCVFEFDFEMDLLMTFLQSNAQLKPCYVVRQHSETDEPGDNMVPEPVSIPDTVELHRVNLFDNTFTLVETKTEGGSETTNTIPDSHFNLNTQLAVVFGYADPNNTNVIDGIYTGVSLRVFSNYDPGWLREIQAFLNAHASDGNIIFGFMLPLQLVRHYYDINWDAKDSGGVAAPCIEKHMADRNLILSLPAGELGLDDKVDGYTPKNKKLLTYPYKYRILSDGNGNTLIFKHEYWPIVQGDRMPIWELQFSINGGNPILRFLPVGYKRRSSANKNMECAFSITGFPMVSWSCDAFSRWISSTFTGKTVKKTFNRIMDEIQ